MMRFPLRLSIALSRARFAQLTGASRPYIQHLDPAAVLNPSSSCPVQHDKLRPILRDRSSILWLGGSEPLEHPGAAHLVRALTRSGRLVFFETNGVALRRRIHEFQPLANFFLVVRCEAGHPGGLAHSVDGLRAARLSGFYTVALSLLNSSSAPGELQALNRSLAELSVDGWLICAASEGARPAAAAAQSLIELSRWQKFSRLLEDHLFAAGRASVAQPQAGPQLVRGPQPPTVPSTGEGIAADQHMKESAAAS